MNFTQIRNMIAVAECKSVSQAAIKLHVAQPAITQSIKSLEAELGTLLFHRGTKGMSLTKHGEVWLNHAKAVQADINRGLNELRKMDEAHNNSLHIAGSPISLPKLIPQAIANTCVDFPSSTINIMASTIIDRHDQLQAFEAGTIDVCISLIKKNVAKSELFQEFLFNLELKAIVRKGHPLAHKNTVTWDDLSRYQWIGSHKDNQILSILNYELKSNGITPVKPAVETINREVKNTLLLNTDMISLTSYHPACIESNWSEFIVLPIKLSYGKWPVGIITKAGTTLSPLAEKFCQHLRTLVKSGKNTE